MLGPDSWMWRCQVATRYGGYNGYPQVDGDAVEIGHEVLAAKVAGLTKTGPRQRELNAVSGVFFKPATMLVNGHLTLSFDGQPPTDLGMKAASDVSTVVPRHKDSDSFSAVHQWLLQVVQHNMAAGATGSARVEGADGCAGLQVVTPRTGAAL